MSQYLRRIRLAAQIFSLCLFVFLFLQAVYPYHPFFPVQTMLQWSPLVALLTLLSSHHVVAAMWPAALILFLTLFLGRFFCGWVCPLGTIIDGFDYLIRPKKKLLSSSSRFRWWKFAILTFVVITAIAGSQLAWVFDPLVIVNRVLTVAIFPIFVFFTEAILGLLWNVQFLDKTLFGIHRFLQSFLLPLHQPYFRQGGTILVLFLLILLLSGLGRRFWCRNFCPLGALLGIFSKYRILQRVVSEQCDSCNVCYFNCRMNAIKADCLSFNKVECINSFECAAVCPKGAVTYRFRWSPKSSPIDLSRRRFLTAGAVGLLGVGLLGLDFPDRNKRGSLIRPPGALSEDQFLDRCIRCQECVRICATTGAFLQPAWLEAGWEGIWSPVGDARYGYCEYTCNLCAQVCPTGAIHLLTLAEKQQTKIGTAYFDKSRCIPWYSGDDCMVCEEHCPTPEKAIVFREGEFVTAHGKVKKVKYPYVIEERCIGCGICVNRCPVEGKPGIFLTRDGEQRY